MGIFYGVDERTRTSHPQFRKLLLYPDELRRHKEIIIIKNRFMQLFILHLLSTRGFYSIHMKNHGENGGGKQHNWYRASQE